ncbi:hypothetical protein FQV27_08780 [Paracoccus aurantiacus]|uniref:Uncharacterized protein n=1 Tax=Paracoccus aurantiacus TaxID=2599412 RepID=A0A5C6S5K6_9RHOB|nr:hypothetical protein [Paracoccus aurantiacus]TXB69062.1 hypothetical protein FQV27_08780 [Paracoccus aurantiacus]
MIGVVIWSSEATSKAVIWCEDQGPLAYLRGREGLMEEIDWPVPGDLLRLECETIGNLRHARSVSIIAPKVCPQLPAALLGHTNRPASHLHIVSSGNSQPACDEPRENDNEVPDFLSPVAIR